MSRTKKGTKGPGFDFWSRRPHSASNNKKLTRRAERQQSKRLTQAQIIDGDNISTIGDNWNTSELSQSIEDAKEYLKKMGSK